MLIGPKSGRGGDPGRRVATGGHGFESPTQVGRKIFGGDAVEASHPRFEASLVGVDVVNMELRFFGLGVAGRRQDMDFELSPLGESGDGLSAVAAEIGRRRNSFAESFLEAGCVEAREDGVERGAGAVASHDDGNLLGREAALGGFAAAATRWPGKTPPPTLERFENEGLIGFDDDAAIGRRRSVGSGDARPPLARLSPSTKARP